MIIEEFVPFNQFFVQDEAMTDVVSITFDIHDKTNNQIFMFDIFINSDNVNELGKNQLDIHNFYNSLVDADIFGTLTIYGRPYGWLGLDNAEGWNDIALIVQNFFF